MKKWIFIVISLLCLVMIGGISCLGGGQEETSQQLISVIRGDITTSISGGGSLRAAEETWLLFGANGKIDEVLVEENDNVVRGQVLAKLDVAPLELALTQAEISLGQALLNEGQSGILLNQALSARAQAETAQIQAQDLYDDAESYLDLLKDYFDDASERVKKAEQQFELAELQLEAANAQLLAAQLQVDAVEPQVKLFELQVKAAEQSLVEVQKQLDNAIISAPFNGTVTTVDIDVGDMVTTNTRAIYLLDLSTMELEAEIDEIDIALVRLGQEVLIDVDALSGSILNGQISHIGLLPQQVSGLTVYGVTISFTVPEDSGLKVGMSATADIIIDKRSEVLLIPERAIIRDSQGNSMVKVPVDDQLQEISVVTGLSDDIMTEIIEGLNEGDIVVVERAGSGSGSGGFFFGG